LVTSDPSKSDITSMFSWITLVILLLLFLLNTRRRIPTLTKDSNSDDNTSVLWKNTATEKEKEPPVVLKDDFIYRVRTSFVIPEYKSFQYG